MPIFDYITKDYQGNYHRGEVEAVNPSDAAGILRRKKLIIISVKGKSQFKEKYLDKFLNQVSFSEVVVFTRQLATMVSSGLILSEAMDILSEQQPNKNFKKILDGISEDLKGGLDFASAIEKYPDTFPNIYSKLVRAGQVSGKLDAILLELANNLEKQRAFQSRVRGAMIYPILVVTMMFGVSLVMVLFVVPRITSLYKESSIELPLPTQILIGFTNAILQFWWLIVFLIILAVIGFRRYLQQEQGRLVFDGILLKSPIAGKIINLVILTNFTRTFALLSASGISILDAIKIVSDISGNLVYKKSLDLAYLGVERGLTFSNQLIASNVFPKIVGQMVKTGEETGKLEDVMFKLSDYFESEADNSLKNITTIIEPIIIVVLGIGVAFLVISIILPIYQLTSNIK